MAGKARRTTHRSSTGTKLYAVRDAEGQGRFRDIQTYKRSWSSSARQSGSKARALLPRLASLQASTEWIRSETIACRVPLWELIVALVNLLTAVRRGRARGRDRSTGTPSTRSGTPSSDAS